MQGSSGLPSPVPSEVLQPLLIQLGREKKRIDEALAANLPPNHRYPPRIHEAMSHAVLAGGKRLRPILVLCAADVVGGPRGKLLEAACAVEFVHTASLILDDLPCMDDAQLRRGKPTVHRLYGESTAILAALSLISYSFELLARNAEALRVRKTQATDAIQELGRSIGADGMSAGQHVDLEIKSYGPSFENLEFIHSRKTGALFTAAARVGAILSKASRLQLDSLDSYAKNLGLAFQITDDILDATSSAEALGKDVGQDEDKTTFVSLFGMEDSHRTVEQLLKTAVASLSIFGAEADLLRGLADYVALRQE